MSSKHLNQFQRLEQSRAALFSRVEGLDESLLNRAPEEGQWSVIQVMWHLTVAEKGSLDYIRFKMKDAAKLEKAGFGSRLKSALLSVVLRLPFKIKAPERAAKVPEHQDLETTRHRWDKIRSAWKETIESFPPELADKAIFKHPVAGPLDLSQALAFTQDHSDRHARQIERILTKVVRCRHRQRLDGVG